MQSMIYQKVLTLKTGGEKLSAQLTNIVTNDMERLFESIISAVFLTGEATFMRWLPARWEVCGDRCASNAIFLF